MSCRGYIKYESWKTYVFQPQQKYSICKMIMQNKNLKNSKYADFKQNQNGFDSRLVHFLENIAVVRLS